MKALMIFGLGAAAFAAASAHAGPIDVPLGTATSFAVLAGASVTNTGATVIDGDLGAWPGAAVTGVSSGIVNGGSIHAADTIAEQAQSDLATAYAAAAGDACASNLSGQDLGGLTLTPGVYCFLLHGAADRYIDAECAERCRCGVCLPDRHHADHRVPVAGRSGE